MGLVLAVGLASTVICIEYTVNTAAYEVIFVEVWRCVYINIPPPRWEGLSASESWEQNQLIDKCKHKPCVADDIADDI